MFGVIITSVILGYLANSIVEGNFSFNINITALFGIVELCLMLIFWFSEWLMPRLGRILKSNAYLWAWGILTVSLTAYSLFLQPASGDDPTGWENLGWAFYLLVFIAPLSLLASTVFILITAKKKGKK
jgi:cytochrome bd-type quinol oxidase subunit 2